MKIRKFKLREYGTYNFLYSRYITQKAWEPYIVVSFNLIYDLKNKK